MLDRIDAVRAPEARLSEEITRQLAPFRRQIELLISIPGISTRSAEMILAEIGAGALPVGRAPGLVGRDVSGQLRVRRQAHSGKSRPGDPWLKNAFGLAATAAARSKNTYLASRYKRIAIRRGKKRALVAVGHTILTSIWHMLTNDRAHPGYGHPGALEDRVGADDTGRDLRTARTGAHQALARRRHRR